MFATVGKDLRPARYPFLLCDFSIGAALLSTRTGAKSSEKVGKTGPENRPDSVPTRSLLSGCRSFFGPEKGGTPFGKAISRQVMRACWRPRCLMQIRSLAG